MPVSEIAAGIALVFLVACMAEVAEAVSRVGLTDLRTGGVIATANPGRREVLDRLCGIAVASTVIWYLALPWVAGASLPAPALVLFLALCAVSVVLLGRVVRPATLRYPAATAAPLLAVATAAALH